MIGGNSVTSRHLDVPVDVVASVLADPRSYDGIVVGSRRVRWFDARWPDEGTTFHHTVGFGPLTIRDRTTVVCDALPGELELAAGARPIGVLTVVFRLRAEGAGTRVEMEEGPRSGPIGFVWNPALALVTARRNDVALKRLDNLATARASVRERAGGVAAGAGDRRAGPGDQPAGPGGDRPAGAPADAG